MGERNREPDAIDRMIAVMRHVAPAAHRVQTANYADLRIAVAHLAEQSQMNRGPTSVSTA